MELTNKTIFSFNFSTLTFADTVSAIVKLAEKRASAYVCVSNVHMLIEAKRDDSFAQVLNRADMVVLDGMPLCWSMKWFHGIKADRIAGRHLMHALLKQCELNQLPVYFYGARPGALEQATRFISDNYSHVTLAGSYSPPFRPLSEREELEVIENIRESGAKIVFVSLGCPKQERWMANMKNKIPAVMLGIGIALEVLTEQQKSTPAWMERSGLEWFFRLCKEPRRLFRRYLITNSAFIFLFLRTAVKRKQPSIYNPNTLT